MLLPHGASKKAVPRSVTIGHILHLVVVACHSFVAARGPGLPPMASNLVAQKDDAITRGLDRTMGAFSSPVYFFHPLGPDI
jgi:hypothetical protein